MCKETGARSIAWAIARNVSYHQFISRFVAVFSLLEDENRLSQPSMLQDFRVKCWNRHARNAHRRSFPPPLDAYIHIYIYIYICTASKETIESDPRDIPPHSLDSISNVLFVRSWCIAWPSLLTPSLEECSTSDWRLARHGSCPRRAPCPTSSRIIIVEAEESSIASWNYFWQGKWWKKKMEETETSISFVLRSTVRLLQKLTSVSPYHSVLFYLKIRGFSTKFNQFRFLCFLYIYSLR